MGFEPGQTIEGTAALLWRFAEAEFDEVRFELRVAGKVRPLEAKPLAILHQLLRRKGELVTKAELTASVWPGVAVVEQSLTTAVSKLRAALDDRDWSIIRSVRGQGYRMGVGVLASPAADAAGPPLDARLGGSVPGRPQWTFERRMETAPLREVWLCRHAKTGERRVFKFATERSRLEALKREAAIARLLRETLGERPDFVPVLEWNFETPPFFLESAFGGPDLAAWAEERGGLPAIPPEERVRVVAAIARTVAAAHDVGVLHRDLKPANVLLGEGGAVRLVDFGSGQVVDAARLATLTGTGLGLAADAPEAGLLAGTFRYAAPEVLAGGTSTALADIYALGVLLYQAVAGDFSRPLAIGWDSDVADPLLRADIAEAACGDPGRRLAAASVLAERLETLPARRAEAAERARDAAERERLAAFAEAQAREAEAARMRAAHATALARRTRIGAGAVAVLAAAAIGLWGYALEEGKLARAQRDRAERASGAGWEAVSHLSDAVLSDVLDQPGVTLETRHRLLDRAEGVVERMSRSVPDDERVQRLGARELDGFANIAIHAGDFARAAALAREAAQVQRALLARHPGDRDLLVSLSQSERWIGDVALAEGSAAAALDAYRQGGAALRAIGDPGGDFTLVRRRAEAEFNLGDVLLRLRKDRGAALTHYRAAEAILQTVPAAGRGDPEWQTALSEAEEKIGDTLDAGGDYAASEGAYREDLVIRRRLAALDPANTRYVRNVAVALGDVGEERTAMGDGRGALAPLLEAAGLYARLAADDRGNLLYQSDVADIAHDIGVAQEKAGDTTAAVASFRRAADGAALCVARSPGDAACRELLGEARGDLGRLTPANQVQEAGPPGPAGR